MTLEKKTRNKLIIDLYSQGKTNRQILTELEKAGYSDLSSIGSVKMQISRLRRAGRIPRERPQPLTKIEKEVAQSSNGFIKFADKITKKKSHKVKKVQKHTKIQSDQKGSGQEFLPVSYRLSADIKWAIKVLAGKSRKDISQLVREILQKYIDEQNDK